VIAGAQQAQVERRVFEDRVDVRPVGVAADQNQRLAGQIVGNTRHRRTGAVIEVEVDLTEGMPPLQGMRGELGLALGAWPEVDAAILQRRIEPCAGQRAKVHAVAGLAGDTPSQLRKLASRRAVGVGIDGGSEFVIADVENSLRSHGPGRQTAEQGHGQLEECFQEINHWLALVRQACAGVALLSMRHLAVT